MAAKLIKILTLVLVVGAGINSNAQGLLSYFKLTADDTKFERFDRIAVDVYHNSFLNLPQGVETEPYSIGISAYWYKDIPFGEKSRMAFAFGAGLSRYNMHHNGYFEEIDDYTHYQKLDYSTTYQVNKFSFNYIDVPLELRFRKVNGKHQFWFPV